VPKGEPKLVVSLALLMAVTVQTQDLRRGSNLLLQDQVMPKTHFQPQDRVFHDSQNALCRRQLLQSIPQSLANPRTPYQAHNTADQEQAHRHNHNHSPDLLPPTKLHPPPRANLEDHRSHKRSKLDALLLLLHLHKLVHRPCHRLNQQHQVVRRVGRQSQHFHTRLSDGRPFRHTGKASHRIGSGDLSKTPRRFVVSL
jgi:hypothetical protein